MRNQPVTILDHGVASDNTVVQMSDGREFLDVNIALPDTDVERIRQGYVCIRCLEPQETPFPEVCGFTAPDGVTKLCNFPIREKQLAEFAVMYKGTVDVGSGLAEEIDRMTEHAEYEAKTGIILPDSVKFPNEVRKPRR